MRAAAAAAAAASAQQQMCVCLCLSVCALCLLVVVHHTAMRNSTKINQKSANQPTTTTTNTTYYSTLHTARLAVADAATTHPSTQIYSDSDSDTESIHTVFVYQLRTQQQLLFKTDLQRKQKWRKITTARTTTNNSNISSSNKNNVAVECACDATTESFLELGISGCEQTPHLSASSYPIIVVYVRLRLSRRAAFSVLHFTSIHSVGT